MLVSAQFLVNEETVVYDSGLKHVWPLGCVVLLCPNQGYTLWLTWLSRRAGDYLAHTELTGQGFGFRDKTKALREKNNRSNPDVHWTNTIKIKVQIQLKNWRNIRYCKNCNYNLKTNNIRSNISAIRTNVGLNKLYLKHSMWIVKIIRKK